MASERANRIVGIMGWAIALIALVLCVCLACSGCAATRITPSAASMERTDTDVRPKAEQHNSFILRVRPIYPGDDVRPWPRPGELLPSLPATQPESAARGRSQACPPGATGCPIPTTNR